MSPPPTKQEMINFIHSYFGNTPTTNKYLNIITPIDTTLEQLRDIMRVIVEEREQELIDHDSFVDDDIYRRANEYIEAITNEWINDEQHNQNIVRETARVTYRLPSELQDVIMGYNITSPKTSMEPYRLKSILKKGGNKKHKKRTRKNKKSSKSRNQKSNKNRKTNRKTKHKH